MKTKPFILIGLIILLTAFLAACGGKNDEQTTGGKAQEGKKEIIIGATAGPYSDQVKQGIQPILEKKGYTVKIVEFNDYVQPNQALAEGSLDANVFQHVVYLKNFAKEHNLPIEDVIQVPTAPIGIYSNKHKSLEEIQSGATVSLPNDPTNQARALVMMQKFGWITLKDNVDLLRVSEKDVAENKKNIKLLPLEAAQLPRSLADADYAFVNGNFAIASGLKLTEALTLEDIPDQYMNLVAIKTADKDASFTKDLVEAYKSAEFKDVIDKQFQGFVKPDYIK
ncbi:MetQ/NlpA family ABC transporter substrate-binding protein [Aneurinibacillus sp. REN35]|uniref:MetQ/NlpA family ABC transporter substrate-binding protein n=1 Tax=Aneurinibacillus sp. REN35 TaxID=3237286 RepID=UPI003528A2B3